MQQATIYGDGSTSRDFTYIDNVIQANILAAMTVNETPFGEVFNVAVGHSNTLNNLHEIINTSLTKQLHGFETKPPIYEEFRVGDIPYSNADISKIETTLGYRPSHTLEEGMELTIKWYNKNKTN
jgi:UDP-N-acetylglucosamine 4-epimerase